MSAIEHNPARSGLKLSPGERAWMRGLSASARGAVTVAILCPLVAGALLVAQAWLLSSVLDRAVVGHAARETLLAPILCIAGLVAARAVLSRIGEGAGSRAAEKIKATIREALFSRVMNEKPEWTRQRASGALASAMVEQVEAVDGFFAHYMPAIIAAVLLPLAFAILVLPVAPIVGLIFLFTAPLIPVFMALVGWGAETASRQQMQAFARLSGFFADRLRGLLTLKLYGRADAEVALVHATSEEIRKRTLAVLRIAFLSSAVLEFFAALGVAGVALYVGLTYLGYLHVFGLSLTLRTGLFCLLMAPEVYMPLRQLAAHYHDRAAANAAVAELAAAFDGLPELATTSAIPTAETLPAKRALPLRATLRVTKSGEDAAILDGAVLALEAGEHVAIVGESGIGKSTLLEALAGMRTFTGEVTTGEHDGDAKTPLRPMVFVGQRPHLFHGTIADNIRLGHPAAGDAEVREAARLACVGEFAERLPLGLDTPVGERGFGLSGGEAQRVGLARLFLTDPGLILLDEPTAHLDEETEARVLRGIESFAEGRTLLVVTHSPAVAALMDRVLRIADGRLSPAPSATIIPHDRPYSGLHDRVVAREKAA
ncbi:ATP-binding cassette, subfamily C, CydD [Faunimonas pinastri]|uniref:ATP-binding cassette, subfamily C, CydD n=1 Tax=Faunimonas pinastri TaxID=1855383 RepID=A0A1H9A7W1_9HYPH|nr:thiol reductant ABC exporter subunit CydD [Faunimonas pinastri]SEP72078.1 ATP-binding cassette, subfamily C, CydD [Faunimonas pinastri]